MNQSRRYSANQGLFDKMHEYALVEGIELIKKAANAKFDESIELTLNLGVDPKYADQNIRGTVILPHGTGKKVRVLVLAQGDKVKEAEDAGADHAGLEDYIKKIEGGWFDFDVCIATPDVMRHVGKLGRALGTRGLMPNPKTGTVTKDVAQAVKEAKAGKISFRVDKYGILHVVVGKASFSAEQLEDNVKGMLGTVMKMKPTALKGTYLKKISISSTQGPGIKIDKQSALA
ncbi:MAG: 50S ribosomal protein L1 [Candidatus Neomarinimicrobiota bacterium]|nr:50S ribosomal protein L1 [Candidatus Neomarinimicrobiota bacterium]RKY53224.1 MAG: 50S ribosomal protein L1 [Candidatus Neomarinimicrobiota bacterium]